MDSIINSIIYFCVSHKHIITIFHVFAVVIGMGGAIVTDFLFVYFAFNKKISKQENKIIYLLASLVSIALILVIITGVLIFLGDITKYLNSAKFLTKMSVVLLLTINGFLLHKIVFSKLKDKNFLSNKGFEIRRRLAFAMGSISFISWATALSLGVLDKVHTTYINAISIYFGLIAIGILSSQIIFYIYEKKKN